MSDFLAKLTAGIQTPEYIKSSDSNNVYAVVAEKNGAKLAMSVVLNIKQEDKKQPGIVGFVLRLIEKVAADADSQQFIGFDNRGIKTYESSLDGKVQIIMMDKLWLPITQYPISGNELFQMILEKEIFEQLREWIKARIAKTEGKLTVTDDTFLSLIASKLETMNNTQSYLFELPDLMKPPYSVVEVPPAITKVFPTLDQKILPGGGLIGSTQPAVKLDPLTSAEMAEEPLTPAQEAQMTQEENAMKDSQPEQNNEGDPIGGDTGGVQSDPKDIGTASNGDVDPA